MRHTYLIDVFGEKDENIKPDVHKQYSLGDLPKWMLMKYVTLTSVALGIKQKKKPKTPSFDKALRERATIIFHTNYTPF